MVLRVNKALRSALRELAITAKDFIVKQIPSFPFPLLSPISTSMPVTRDIGSVAGWSVQYLINDIDMFQPLWSSATIGQPRIYVSTNTYTWIPSRRRTITPVCKYRGEWRVAEKKKVGLKLHCTTEKVLWLLRTDNLFSTVPKLYLIARLFERTQLVVPHSET